MIIREAILADASAIAQVHVDAWRTTYCDLMPVDFLANLSYQQRESMWIEIFSNAAADNFTYVVENETGQIVGFASGGRERTNNYLNCGELYAIYILQNYQRQGLGYRLMTQVAARLVKLDMNSMLVWVLADNPACRFYQSFGGLQVNEKQQEFGKVGLVEIAYLFKDMRSLLLKYE